MIDSKLPRRWWRWVWALPMAPVLAVGGRYDYWIEVENRLTTVVAGVLEQSAEMAPGELVALTRSRGYHTVVDLRDTRPEEVAAERRALREAGIRHLHLPMPQDPTREQLEEFLEVAARPENQPVLVHCAHCEGRSVLVGALYRMRRLGLGSEQAWRASSRLPPDLRWMERLWPGLMAPRRDGVKGRILFGFDAAAPSAAASGR